jgi:hypothetical protein
MIAAARTPGNITCPPMGMADQSYYAGDGLATGPDPRRLAWAYPPPVGNPARSGVRSGHGLRRRCPMVLRSGGGRVVIRPVIEADFGYTNDRASLLPEQVRLRGRCS